MPPPPPPVEGDILPPPPPPMDFGGMAFSEGEFPGGAVSVEKSWAPPTYLEKSEFCEENL